MLLPLAAVVVPSAVGAQWSTTYEQFYMPGKFNWQFRANYPAADRLFNAFDYGHAILYERLWAQPNAPVSHLEEEEYAFITRELLVNPPRIPLEEAAIEVRYAKLVPEVKLMFDWAHLFHRQVYDVWADERMPVAEKDAKVAGLLRYYRSRRDLAFSSLPKTMELMEAQPYSLAFRKEYPKFNGLIWAYHWLQVGLYEPLVAGKNKDERQTGVLAAVARFRQMIENPPTNMPRIMPMTAAISPTFAARYPEAAIIFDNLHSMHDVVSDILANDDVPRGAKRARILEAARRYRDNTSYVMSVEEWRSMAQMMGIENMGGPAVGFLAQFPTPTVERGAVMAGMDHSKMPGMRKDSTPGVDHARMGHDSARGREAARDTARTMEKGHPHDSLAADTTRLSAGRAQQMMELHMRMLSDSVIRRRVLADTAMRRMMMETVDEMPAEHREHLQATSDSAAVAAIVDRFHGAVAAGDSALALSLLAADAVVLESGGIETREEFRAHHLAADIAFARAVKSERGPKRVVVQGDAAWVTSTSTATGEYRGRQVSSSGAELMVLTRTPQGWRIAAIHWSSRTRRPTSG